MRSQVDCEANKQAGGWVQEGGGLRSAYVRAPEGFVAHLLPGGRRAPKMQEIKEAMIHQQYGG